MRAFLATTCTLAMAGLLVAGTQVIDGLNVTAGPWPAAVAVQDTNTQFGNNENELNQMFLDSDAGSQTLYIGLSGNLADVNSLHLYFDTDPGTNPPTQIKTAGPSAGGCPIGERPRIIMEFSNTRFDADFDPDYSMNVSTGKFPGQSDTDLIFASDLLNLDTLANASLGIGSIGSGNGLLTGNQGIEIAIDNSNTDGVGDFGGGPDPNTGAPATATTGIEIAIPYGQLGITSGSPIRVFAYISNSGENATLDPNAPCATGGFGSNQALPGLQGAMNLGPFSGATDFIRFDEVAGTQFVNYTVD